MSYRLLDILSQFFHGTVEQLTAHLTITILLVFALAAWYRFDPKPAARTAQFAGLGMLVLVQLQILYGLVDGTLERLDASRNAVYSSVGDQAGGDTLQYAPSASYQELSSREQTLTLLDKNLQTFGLAALPGWNGSEMEPSSTILAVRDKLEVTPHATIVRRSIDFHRYVTLPLKSSVLGLKLDFVPNSVAYQARFTGSYQFRNPLEKKALLRFTFPLPADSGTLSDFRMTVNGQPSGPEWVGEVEPGKAVQVKVAYLNRGRRSWTYSPTRARESIGELRLELSSDNSSIKFRKDSLFPSSTVSGRWTWNMRDVITSQDISLFFPTTPKRDLVEKTLSFAPGGLLVYLLTLSFALGAKPKPLLVGVLAYTGGVVLSSYLWTYLAFLPGLFWGFTVGLAFAGGLLGRRGLAPTCMGWLTWLAFGFPGHTGLILTSLGLLVLAFWALGALGEGR